MPTLSIIAFRVFFMLPYKPRGAIVTLSLFRLK